MSRDRDSREADFRPGRSDAHRKQDLRKWFSRPARICKEGAFDDIEARQ
jgi:hypothetical protein